MATFGWSVGDIIASIQLVAKIASALKETDGAKSDYRESIEFLFGLEVTLQNLRSIAPIIITPSHQDILQFEVEKIAKPLSDFFAKVQKFDAALGVQSRRGAWRTAPRKVQWAMSVSKEVQALRDRISVPISSLNIMLQSQTLYAITMLQEKLPGDVSDRIASSIETAVSKGLKQELDNLKIFSNTNRQIQFILNQKSGNITEDDTEGAANYPSIILKHNDEASKHATKYLEFQGVHTSSRLEQLIHEQSSDLKALNTSLSTIVRSQKFPSNCGSKEDFSPLRNSLSELKLLFAKCMYLLALSLRDLFKEALLYLGPQFLVFFLVLKNYGTHMPRLLLGDNILFEDVLGRQKYLPVEFFQHYNVFSTFLRESFAGVPGQKYVLNQRYLLKDANNAIVDSTKWPQTVAKRSNITMSVILDEVSDGEVACPRCWTPESVTKPGENIQCSSCGLIYEPPAPKPHLQKQITGFSELSETPLENSGHVEENTTDVEAVIPSNISKTEESEDWGKTTVIDLSRNLDNLTLSNTATNYTSRLPWDYEDLDHFKRVQFAETRSIISPHLSTLNRLVLVLVRLREETLRAQSKSGSLYSEQAKEEMRIFISYLESCPGILSNILIHPYFETFFLEADRDQRSQIWSQAWLYYALLKEKSKNLFLEARNMYQGLKDHGTLNLLKGYSGLQRVEMAFQLNQNLRCFLDSLQILWQIESAWTHGGLLTTREIETPRSTINTTQFEEGVATSLEVTSDYIIVALDSGNISVFKHNGAFVHALIGHVMGVWTLVAQGDILVSGGSDRDVRIWEISTGYLLYTLRGHTSTVRCMKFASETVAISGSRDTTMRIWDITNGICKNVLVGHEASVRCLEVKGDIIVSGSYDSTARVWSVSKGRCLRTLVGHFSQIYCVAFDGNRLAATGSLDTSIRVWDIVTGRCQAVLQGHTALVGQIRLSNNTIITGSSDGSVRLWSLQKMAPIRRLAAADNSITSLSFDSRRLLAGSSDGTAKVWDMRTGNLIRELGNRTDTVFELHLEETMAVITRRKSSKTVIEIWSFLNPSLDSKIEVIN